MERKDKNNKLAFENAFIAELNNEELSKINGGIGPAVVAVAVVATVLLAGVATGYFNAKSAC